MALVGSAVGLAILGFIGTPVGVYLGTAVFAIGIAFLFPALLALAVSRVGELERGTVVGTTTAFLDLSFGLAPAMLGLAVGVVGLGGTFVISALIALFGSVLLFGRRDAVARSVAPGSRYAAGVTIERVFVAGAGLMGHGIAQVHAAIGMTVVLYEPDLERAEAGRERIAGNLDRSVAKGRITQDERDATLARVDGRRRTSGSSPTRTSSSRPSSRTSPSSTSSGGRSTGSRAPTRSSPRTRARSRSTGWRTRPRPSGASGSSACTSSVPCRSCRSWS